MRPCISTRPSALGLNTWTGLKATGLDREEVHNTKLDATRYRRSMCANTVAAQQTMLGADSQQSPCTLTMICEGAAVIGWHKLLLLVMWETRRALSISLELLRLHPTSRSAPACGIYRPANNASIIKVEISMHVLILSFAEVDYDPTSRRVGVHERPFL